MPVTRACDHCGSTYSRPASQAGSYCSQKCAYTVRRKEKPARYRMLYRPGHPLAGESPYIPEHRVLLWEKLGPGAHPCYRCGTLVRWTPGSGCAEGALVTDHINRDRTNNSLDNLAPACQPCNIGNREYAVTDDEAHVVRPDGTRLRGEHRTCASCGGEFVARPDPRPNRGRFCSRACARRALRQ